MEREGVFMYFPGTLTDAAGFQAASESSDQGIHMERQRVCV
jgi:hypothetical protein